ncbi:lipocalin family protein [Aquaticitalea lipolytica]|uniref:lipocalin family protein n=1 Tax=Aquaticitalea lipolytica TaxID=1247562 RepID=UPI0024B8D341|nr:lipocalin family protein [Aquaticitalea lipolytica]
MRKVFLLLALGIIFSCSKDPETLISHLNGYWEIDEVTLPDGTKRDYNYNDTIDFLSINDSLTGFRKKMKPNFDGSFSTSNDAEALKIVIENDSLNIYYKTPYSEWKETVLDATEDKLLIQNKDKLIYLYKRYEPLVIE